MNDAGTGAICLCPADTACGCCQETGPTCSIPGEFDGTTVCMSVQEAQLASSSDSNASATTSTGAIVGGLIGGLMLIALVVVAVVVRRRKDGRSGELEKLLPPSLRPDITVM